MPKINSLEVVHQDTNKDSYQNLHDILKNLLVDKEVVDGTARATIENLLELYADDKEAFLKSLQTLTAQFKEIEAQLTDEIYLRASELEALAKKTTTLSARTESQIASVTQYSEAVASDVERKVSTYSQDDAPTGTLSYGDLWFDTDDNKKAYRWNGIAWIATDDTRIATTYARWGVNVDANGHVAGIQLNADNTGTSEFTVLADNFKVFKSGNTSSPMFDVGTVAGVTTVGIRGNLVVDGTITTGGLANNAVSVPASYWNTSGISGSGSFQNVAQVTVTNSASSSMYVSGTFSCFIAVSATGQIYTLQVQGYGGNNILLNMGGVEAVGSHPSVTFADTIPASTSVTYVIFWDAPSTVSMGARSLVMLGTKK